MDALKPGAWQRTPTLPTVAGYFALVWSQIAVIAATTALGTLIGAGLALRLPSQYQAGVAIELPGVPTSVNFDPAADPPQRTTIDSTAQLLFSTPVVQRVARVTSLSPSQVSDGLSVSAYPLSRVLIASFRASSADLAVSGANEAAAALISQRKDLLEGNQFVLAASLATYLHRLLPEANRKAGFYNPVSKRLLGEIAQIDLVRQQIAADHARVLKPAAPATSVRPHGELQVVTGAMLGFLVGVAYAWWRPRRARRPGPPVAA
jgi:uncharacterized protein involved in exopolysaccharide biosynthesis